MGLNSERNNTASSILDTHSTHDEIVMLPQSSVISDNFRFSRFTIYAAMHHYYGQL